MQPEPRKMNATKFLHEFHAAMIEYNAGQYETESILILFYRCYIICVIAYSFINRQLITESDLIWVL